MYTLVRQACLDCIFRISKSILHFRVGVAIICHRWSVRKNQIAMSQYNLHVVQGTEVQFYITQVTNTKCKSHRHSTEADILNGYDRLRLRQNG